MRTHAVTSVTVRFADFFTGIVNWFYDTFDLLLEIMIDFLARAIELAIVILQLSFQIICFLRDVCIEAMQTFVNIFRGIVYVISSIKCEDVEDFVAACMVVFLWIGAVKITLKLFDNRTKPFPNPLNWFRRAPCTPIVVEKVQQSEMKNQLKKKVTVQSKKGSGYKRPVSSSISSSSSASYNVRD